MMLRPLGMMMSVRGNPSVTLLPHCRVRYIYIHIYAVQVVVAQVYRLDRRCGHETGVTTNVGGRRLPAMGHGCILLFSLEQMVGLVPTCQMLSARRALT